MKDHKIGFKIIKEYKDGSAEMEFEYDDEFVAHIKKKFNIKRLTKKRLGSIILEALSRGVESDSGGDRHE